MKPYVIPQHHGTIVLDGVDLNELDDKMKTLRRSLRLKLTSPSKKRKSLLTKYALLEMRTTLSKTCSLTAWRFKNIL